MLISNLYFFLSFLKVVCVIASAFAFALAAGGLLCITPIMIFPDDFLGKYRMVRDKFGVGDGPFFKKCHQAVLQ